MTDPLLKFRIIEQDLVRTSDHNFGQGERSCRPTLFQKSLGVVAHASALRMSIRTLISYVSSINTSRGIRKNARCGLVCHVVALHDVPPGVPQQCMYFPSRKYQGLSVMH